jgi:phosphate transport system substrate-binding protein
LENTAFDRIAYFLRFRAKLYPKGHVICMSMGMCVNAKRKRISAIAAAVFCFAAMTGCGNGGTAEKQTVSVDGSTSMEKVIGYLGEIYSQENSDVKITYNPTGSGSGIQAVIDSRCDIGLSSRELTADEKEKVTAYAVAADGIAVIVNADNTAENLTSAEISDIFTGKITNWSEVGGSDSPIVCIGREAASGTRDGFETATETSGMCVYSQELTSSGDVVQTVSSNPNAVGYTSLSAVGDSVKTVSIDGVFPTEGTVRDGSYKIKRDFFFVIPKDRELSQAASDFFDFAKSSAAAEYITMAGAVAIADSE